MHVLSHVLSAAKAGLSEAEYEDAAYPRGVRRRAGRRLRYAVADGATETSFARLWAELLVRGYVRGRPRRPARWLPRAQAAWRAEVGNRPLPWYAEEKARAGAFAALLGLELDAEGTWRATAAGDSCLFQVRGEALIYAFPIAAAGGFTNRPALLSSDPSQNAALPRLLRADAGGWRAGDRFFLMTDAIAQWFLAEVEAGAAPWRTLDLVGREPGLFADWLAALRHGRCLRNDDVTVLALEPRAEPFDGLADPG